MRLMQFSNYGSIIYQSIDSTTIFFWALLCVTLVILHFKIWQVIQVFNVISVRSVKITIYFLPFPNDRHRPKCKIYTVNLHGKSHKFLMNFKFNFLKKKKKINSRGFCLKWKKYIHFPFTWQSYIYLTGVYCVYYRLH